MLQWLYLQILPHIPKCDADRQQTLARMISLLLRALLLLSAFVAHSPALLTNITIDDAGSTDGLQIVYSPPGYWSLGETCNDCEAHVNSSEAHNGTWHDTTFFPDQPPPSPLTASLTFVGAYTPPHTPENSPMCMFPSRRGDLRLLYYHARIHGSIR